MIDRIARDKLAELLHQFIAGRLDNFEFENSVPNSSDPAINEIWWNAAWPLYDDFQTHKMIGEWEIPNEHRRDLAKAILFLKTNKEYVWPKVKKIKPFHIVILNILTLGLYGKWYRSNRSKGFEKEAWPFAFSIDLEEANSNPVYLSKK